MQHTHTHTYTCNSQPAAAWMEPENKKWNICRSISIFRWKVAFHKRQEKEAKLWKWNWEKRLTPKTDTEQRQSFFIIICCCAAFLVCCKCVCVIFTFPLLTKIFTCVCVRVCVHIGPRIKQHSKRTDTTPTYTHTHTQTENATTTKVQWSRAKLMEHNYRNSKRNIHELAYLL